MRPCALVPLCPCAFMVSYTALECGAVLMSLLHINIGMLVKSYTIKVTSVDKIEVCNHCMCKAKELLISNVLSGCLCLPCHAKLTTYTQLEMFNG